MLILSLSLIFNTWPLYAGDGGGDVHGGVYLGTTTAAGGLPGAQAETEPGKSPAFAGEPVSLLNGEYVFAETRP